MQHEPRTDLGDQHQRYCAHAIHSSTGLRYDYLYEIAAAVALGLAQRAVIPPEGLPTASGAHWVESLAAPQERQRPPLRQAPMVGTTVRNRQQIWA
jgi:hypothetical protein